MPKPEEKSEVVEIVEAAEARLAEVVEVEAKPEKAHDLGADAKTLVAAAEVAKAKRKLNALTEDLAKCRTHEKELLQAQAQALNEFKQAQQALLKGTME
jgi:outer membrane PBP1 activator LpoA protein